MFLKQYEVESRVEFFKEPIGDILRRYRTIKKYAYILHDKDADTSPHYHIYLNFGKSGVDSKKVAEWFGLQESQVNKIRGRATDMLEYLTHSNPSQRHKYQYSPSEVISNFDFEDEIKQSKIIGNFKEYTYAQQLEYINNMPVSEKGKHFDKLKKLWQLHCQVKSLDPDRYIEVMFIHGEPGVGKTYYAKKFAESKKYDVCISSSSNDPWQDYFGQDCMILDDMRDSTFDFADFLKVTDNNTNSSVQARYGNKLFTGKLIIITSSVALSYWYRHLMFNNSESLQQLYRRISAYVEITESEVRVYGELDAAGRPAGFPTYFRNELVKLKKQPKQEKTDFAKAFGEFCEEIPFEELIESYEREKNKR